MAAKTIDQLAPPRYHRGDAAYMGSWRRVVDGMDVRIGIVGGNGEELVALGEWLQGEEELRGRIRTVHRTIGDTELGPVVEVLTVALGAGGAGTVLASSLKTWLLTRKTTAKIIVKSGKRSITLDIQTADELAPLLEQILKAGDDG
jgi:hypothetical protein